MATPQETSLCEAVKATQKRSQVENFRFGGKAYMQVRDPENAAAAIAYYAQLEAELAQG